MTALKKLLLGVGLMLAACVLGIDDDGGGDAQDAPSDADAVVWTSRGVDNALDFDGVPIPPKITPGSRVRPECKERMQAWIPAFVTIEQNEALQKVMQLLLDEAEHFHSITPDDLKRLLHKHNQRYNEPCVYVLHDPHNDKAGSEIPKAGDSGQCNNRIRRQAKAGHKAFRTMPPEEMIEAQFIRRETLDALVKLISKLPLLAGFHADNLLRLIEKIIRQIGEEIVTCAYEFRDGNIAEFLLRSPSERENKLTDIYSLVGELPEQQPEMAKILSPLTALQIVKVFIWDTWPTIDSVLREARFSRLSLLMNPREQSITEHLVKESLNSEAFAGWEDAMDCPFYEVVLSLAEKVRDIVVMAPRPPDAKERIEAILMKMPAKEYKSPSKEDLARETKKRLDAIFENENDDYSNILIVVRAVAMDAIRKIYPEWYAEHFLTKYDIKDTKLRPVQPGSHTVEFVDDGSAIIVYYTPSCHRIMEVKSHFMMAAPNHALRHHERLNAIRNYLLYAAVMNSMKLLSSEGLHRVWQTMLSLTMMANGLSKTLNVEPGERASIHDGLLHVLPKSVYSAAMLPGQSFLQSYFHVPVGDGGDGSTEEDAEDAEEDADEYDLFGDDDVDNAVGVGGATRKLTARTILVLLHVLGKDNFNQLLGILGNNRDDVNVVVDERDGDGKFFLKINNSIYWAHFLHFEGKGNVDRAVDVATQFLSGEFEASTTAAICRTGEVCDSTLEAVRAFYNALYVGINTTNDPVRARSKLVANALEEMAKLGIASDEHELHEMDVLDFIAALKTFGTAKSWNVLQDFWGKVGELTQQQTNVVDEDGTEWLVVSSGGTYSYFVRLRNRTCYTDAQRGQFQAMLSNTRYANFADAGLWDRIIRVQVRAGAGVAGVMGRDLAAEGSDSSRSAGYSSEGSEEL